MTTARSRRRFWRRRSFWAALALVALATASLVAYQRSSAFRGAMDTVRRTSADAATATKVKTALALSKRVTASDIEVEARGGEVVLSGQVPTREVKVLAEELAATTAGVSMVRSRLTVPPRSPGLLRLEEMTGRLADLEIETTIQQALLKNAELEGAWIEVEVKGGAVTLSGAAQTSQQRQWAELTARAVDGVGRVLNEVKVPPSAEPDGDAPRLAKQVEFELYATRALDLDAIRVTVAGGRVTLEGLVRSEAERLLAERVAAATEGVDGVVNRLRVGEAPATLAETPS